MTWRRRAPIVDVMTQIDPRRLDVAVQVRMLIESGEARRLREGAGLSGREVARRCQVDPAAVSRWELGDRFPAGANLRRYARLLATLVALAEERDASHVA